MILVAACGPYNPAPVRDGTLDKPGAFSYYLLEPFESLFCVENLLERLLVRTVYLRLPIAQTN